ncbi:MAG TPA: electron transport complex subunit RsxC, partial [Accumulibacter sp.]|nr:electron transport complex subunit RsxC [Accumulibacter sp.]
RARIFGKTQEYHIFDCIECGCCSYVCPSHIPLVQYFRFAKSEIWAREREKKAADAAKARFELRNAREEREKEEKAERLAKAAAAKAAERKTVVAQSNSDAAGTPRALEPQDTPPATGESADSAGALDAEALKKATIQAAMERARAQRAGQAARNTDRLTPEQAKEIAAVDARRARQASSASAPPAPPERSPDSAGSGD